MTDIVETYEETVTRPYVVKTVCDKCGCEVDDGKSHDTRDFELEFTTGKNYPDCGYQEGWQVPDLCNDCVGWLKTVLQDNGVTIKEIERDW